MNNIENREFKTIIIATIIENYICGEFKIDELYDFASFILEKHLRYGDLHNYKYMIINKIFNEYPELRNAGRININLPYNNNKDLINKLYIDKYGDYMSFKGKSMESTTKRKILNIKKY